jgi:hypothetical protein
VGLKAAKDDAQIAKAQRMAAGGSASMRPGRAALSARWTNVRLQRKGLLLGLRSPLALVIRLGVALAQPVQSCFDLHHGLDAEADLFPVVRAKPLNPLVGALAMSWEARSLKSRAILGPVTSLAPPASLLSSSPPAAALWLTPRRTTIAIH